jgi:hypothetical protein
VGHLEALRDWLVRIGADDWVWFAKRLSANDTGLTRSHQVGFYVPRQFALAVAPELERPVDNPRRRLAFHLVSHDQVASPDLIYYNSRIVRQQRNGRNEFRVTGFGGRQSALQDPESTGAILITASYTTGDRVEAWLADTLEEEDALESVIGSLEPATEIVRLFPAGGLAQLVVAPSPADCEPDLADLPAAWATAFPAGRELMDEAVRRRPGRGHGPDRRLVDRYRCEFGLFKVVETAHVLPLIGTGFPTVDDFLGVAQTVANRRKSRAGRSLELHLARIFTEERVPFEAGARTEGNRQPDFLFPSGAAYRAGRPTRMLGVKTTVKDRWRQVLDEASRIPEKHLFTLSEGVSPDQFTQMQEARLQLVVPAANVHKFPVAVRPHLATLADFIDLVR